ncbi:MAG: hypothetical protein LBQ15_00295 [Clostridium sp.]|jgi:hypothetical protein|nr:hypothetical protein [Clostridium sp.]
MEGIINVWDSFLFQERVFVLVLAGNTAVSVLSVLWGWAGLPFCRRLKPYSRASYGIRGMILFLCPVAGILFFLGAFLFQRLLFCKEADLANVVFHKETRRGLENVFRNFDGIRLVKADEERGRGLVPMEEALAVSDKESLRVLVMNVIRGDVRKSLSAIFQALNCEDSETAHYAASVLRDELDDFRMQVQRLYQEMKREKENQVSCGILLLESMNGVLEQKVFTGFEQESLIRIMEESGETVYRQDPGKMESRFFEWISLRLLEVGDYGLAEKWCRRGMEAYPDELSSHTCFLKLYFTIQDRERFFQIMENIRKTDITIDSTTLELIRIFS